MRTEKQTIDAGSAEAEAEYNAQKHEYGQCSSSCAFCKSEGVERWPNDWYLDKNGKPYR